MFGCLAVYVGEKIVFILRDKPPLPADNGVWLATTEEHHATLQRDFPTMRSIGLLGKKVTGWQVLPMDAPNFEESALRTCELVIASDPRIGKVPASRRVAKSVSRRQTASKANRARDKATGFPTCLRRHQAASPTKTPGPLLTIRLQNPPGDVYKYASRTGGDVMKSSKQNVSKKLAQMIDEIRTRYTLGYIRR
jgi:hypothetical protein